VCTAETAEGAEMEVDECMKHACWVRRNSQGIIDCGYRTAMSFQKDLCDLRVLSGES